MKTLLRFSFTLIFCLFVFNSNVSAQTPQCSSSAGVVSKMWKAWKDLGFGDASGLNDALYLNRADRGHQQMEPIGRKQLGDYWPT